MPIFPGSLTVDFFEHSIIYLCSSHYRLLLQGETKFVKRVPSTAPSPLLFFHPCHLYHLLGCSYKSSSSKATGSVKAAFFIIVISLLIYSGKKEKKSFHLINLKNEWRRQMQKLCKSMSSNIGRVFKISNLKCGFYPWQ